MNNHVTMEQCIASLEANGLRYGLLELQNGVRAILTEYGGRILGPFQGEGEESVFWTSAALADSAALGRLTGERAWNIGGDRVWIAPEIQYNVRDRSDFWGSLALPPQMDPGSYALERLPGSAWRLSQALTLEAHNLAQGRKSLRVERMIRPAADPLRNLTNHTEVVEGVAYAGYEQTVTLTDLEPNTIVSEAWSLIQVNPGGQLWIPATTGVEVTDYYEPIDARHLQRHANMVCVQITGDRQYKIGLQAAQLFGRAAYVNASGKDDAILIVRSFFNNPSAPYVEEPAHLIGRSGHSVHVYNDDGNLGGFGEVECHGQAIGGALGRAASADQFLVWIYVGSKTKIDAILATLIGASP